MILIVETRMPFFERAVAAGAAVVSQVSDQPYGWRVGRVVDPFGHHWESGKPLSRIRSDDPRPTKSLELALNDTASRCRPGLPGYMLAPPRQFSHLQSKQKGKI